jgi:hypothetical protein
MDEITREGAILPSHAFVRPLQQTRSGVDGLGSTNVKMSVGFALQKGAFRACEAQADSSCWQVIRPVRSFHPQIQLLEVMQSIPSGDCFLVGPAWCY